MPDQQPADGELRSQLHPKHHAQEVLEAAAERDPDHVFALVSGGHDSATAMRVAHRSDHLDIDAVVHINTNIGIEQTREWVRERCAALDLPYIEIRNHTPWEQYPELVKKHGFPSPAVHDEIYAMLKGKPLRELIRSFPADVMFISGVYRRESDTRMETLPIDGINVREGAIWVAPLVEWTPLEIRKYRRRNDLPMNEVVDIMEMSGECLCGAFSDRSELNLLREFFHDTWRFINCIESTVQGFAQLDSDRYTDPEYAKWGHHSDGIAWNDAAVDDGPGQQMVLCTDCQERDSRSEGGGSP